MQRKIKKRIVGIVTEINSAQTITVLLKRLVRFPKYGKYIRKTSSYKVHDEKNEARVGDEVEVAEARPFSKTKKWRLVKITKKTSAQADIVASGGDVQPLAPVPETPTESL